MLLVHRHPLNKDTDPKVVNSHQTVYKRTNVDLNSRWLVEWEDFVQGSLMTDLGASGQREATAVLQCEEGDLVIACKSAPLLSFRLFLLVCLVLNPPCPIHHGASPRP